MQPHLWGLGNGVQGLGLAQMQPHLWGLGNGVCSLGFGVEGFTCSNTLGPSLGFRV